MISFEPDSPPQSGTLEDYLYKEFQRIADTLNANFDEIEERLASLEARVNALETP